MPLSDLIKELFELIDDLASGKVTIEDARKRATALQARKAEVLSDELLAELDGKIAALKAPTAPPFEPGDIEAEANKLIRRRARQTRDAETRRLWRFEEARMLWVQQHKNEPGCAEHVAELEAAIKQAIPDPWDSPSGSSTR